MTLAACASTQQESEKIGREGRRLSADPGSLRLGAVNHGVRLSDVTLLSSAGRTAVAAKLTGTAARPQLDLPVLVEVTGARGKVLYSNGTGGLEASLQRMASLRPGHGEWWVDDQVLTSQRATAVRLRVGTGSSPRAGSAPPTLSTTPPHVAEQGGVSVLSASIVNHSVKAQEKVPVFAVAVRGGRVVAAGRAVVSVLAGHPGASAPFQIFLVGNPTGASIQLSVLPTAA